MELIQLKEVGKSYKKNKILEDVSISIEEGSILGIIGQSGSGKTTLLNLISGFIEPTEGEITYTSKIDNKPKNLNKNFHKIKKHIGFTPQHTSIYPKLTVMENIMHFGRLYGLKKSLILENAKSLLEFTGLAEHKDKLADQLSGGMQKRLDLSCSLIHKPKLLVLDEPTSDLDPVTQEEIIHLIQEVNKQGITIVIASHHLESLERICDKIAVLHKGRVKSYGEMEDVRKPHLKDHFTINVKTGAEKEKLVGLLKKMPVSKIIDQDYQLVIHSKEPERTILGLIRLTKDENLCLNNLDFRKISLGEIFTELTKE